MEETPTYVPRPLRNPKRIRYPPKKRGEKYDLNIIKKLMFSEFFTPLIHVTELKANQDGTITKGKVMINEYGNIYARMSERRVKKTNQKSWGDNPCFSSFKEVMTSLNWSLSTSFFVFGFDWLVLLIDLFFVKCSNVLWF